MRVTAVRTMTGGSLPLRRKQVHIFTAKVDVKEEASAEEGSHYTYSVTAGEDPDEERCRQAITGALSRLTCECETGTREIEPLPH